MPLRNSSEVTLYNTFSQVYENFLKIAVSWKMAHCTGEEVCHSLGEIRYLRLNP